MKEKQYIGELIDFESDSVQLDCPKPNGEWSAHWFPKPLFEGHINLEIGSYACVRIRYFEDGVSTKARSVTQAEKDWLLERKKQHEIEIMKRLDELDDDMFTPIE